MSENSNSSVRGKRAVYVLIAKSTIDLTKPSFFDIYVPVGDKFVKVINALEPIDEERINRYLDKSEDILFIESNHIERFLDEKFTSIFDRLSSKDESISLRVRNREIIRTLELCLLDIRLVRFHPDKFMRLSMVITHVYGALKKKNERGKLLQVTNEAASNVFTRRSILGAIMAMSFCFEQGDLTQAMFSDLMMASLVRDLCCEFDNDNDPHDKLSEFRSFPDDIKQSYLKHPQAIFSRLTELRMGRDAVEYTIMQHHEHPNGNGFPKGLKRAETYLPAQYVWLADWMITHMKKLDPYFSNAKEVEQIMTDDLPHEQKKSLPYVIRIFRQMLPEKIKKEIIKSEQP